VISGAGPATLLPPAVQVVLLAGIAGYVDAVGFLRYQGFACQITGNTASPLLGLAMGMQTTAATRFGKATVNTVFITADVQRLFEGVVALLWRSSRHEVPRTNDGAYRASACLSPEPPCFG